VRCRPRGEGLRLVPRLIQLIDDPSPGVRREARASLTALAGRDAGGEGAGAAARWRAAFEAPGPPSPWGERWAAARARAGACQRRRGL